jgi:hypothetical protein
MKRPEPMIKFNGGKPIALCNRCFIIMCYVRCAEDDCVVIDRNGNGKVDYITTPIGQTPPPYCDECNKLLTFTLNE